MGSTGTVTTSTEQENLEESMRKAEEETMVLKSVVVPLENEIKILKTKLAETEAKLTEALKLNRQNQEGPVVRTGDNEGRKSPSLPALNSITDVNVKVEKLLHYLKAEKAARKDLEMYVAVLTTQKSMLESRTDEVNKELQNVCHLLEEEKQSHEALKQTWQMANDQFLESQRLLLMDLRRMEGVLTREQQMQIADLRRIAANDVPVKIFFKVQDHLVETNSSMRRLSSMPDFTQIRKGKETNKSQKQERKADCQIFSGAVYQTSNSATPNADDETSRSSSTMGISSSASSSECGDDLSGDEFEDDFILPDPRVPENQSLNKKDNTLQTIRDDTKGMTVIRISSDKVLNLPPLTDAQMKAITETEAYKSIIADMKSNFATRKLNLEGKRLVSEKEWALLQEEMKASRENLGQPCQMCSRYETQLQRMQEEIQSATIKLKKREKLLESERQTNTYLQKSQSELQLALKNAAEDAQTQIVSLTSRLQDCEKCVKDFKEQMFTIHHLLQDHCKTLTANREEVQRELTKLQDENDRLVDKYSKTALQLQNVNITLPSNFEEMQFLLRKYREEIITAKMAKEHIEETLKGEVAFLKSKVIVKQQEKFTLEETLTREINALKSKIAEMDNLRQELEQETMLRSEAEAKLQETETSLKGVQVKSKQILSKMQEKLEELDKRKSNLESENHTYRKKVHSLQADLANSEAVQRDFVKLSQSLQIQLEKIRQEENEIRWQYEDDVDDCNSCKQSFTVTKRKHHCRHCGKIFCSDCTSKSVSSGPNFRPAKVCDVCHTILVKDAAPYFGTETPYTPN